jgi:NAD(P)-dependent dehydrogenase (short-subunit alcohol dehydrogenase family)
MSKTVVITGTNSGFGKAAVQRFAREGWNVVATVRRQAEIGVHAGLEKVRTLLLDVNDEAAAAPFARDAIAAFGRVDALVNNAGYYQMGPLESSSMEQIHRQFQTNVFGLMALTKAFVPSFRAQRAGVIVNIASISADQGYPYTSVYSASKAAVASFTEGLNIELADFGVTAKAVFPGSHATRIFTKIDVATGTPSDYQPGMQRFFSAQGTGSVPDVTVDVIWMAVNDVDGARVRYYSGPDGEVIPRLQQMLGRDWYWREFRAAALGNASPLWKSIVHAGDVKIEWKL